MTNYRSQHDAGYHVIAAVFARTGCTVVAVAPTGFAGWPTFVVGCDGLNRLVEVAHAGTQTPEGLQFNDRWQGEPCAVVSSLDDVTALVALWRDRTV